MRTKVLLIAAAVAGVATAQADATRVAFSTGTLAAYNNTTDFTPVPFNPTLNPATTGVVYEIPVYFQVSDLAPGQSFGNVLFNATLTGDLSLNLGGFPPYEGDFPSYPEGKTSVPYYILNSDFGSSPIDLRFMVASIPSDTTAGPRLTMGVDSPFLLGWIYVNLPAGSTNGGTVTITPAQYSNNVNGLLLVDDAANLVGTTVTFLPEPTSLALAGAGLFALMTHRRCRLHV